MAGKQKGISSLGPPEKQIDMLHALLANASDCMYLLDREGRCLYISPKAEGALGAWHGDAAGKTGREPGLPPEIREPLEGLIGKVFATGEPIQGETEIRSKDSARSYEYLIAPASEANGTVEAVIVSVRDITDCKRAEEQLQKTHQALHLANSRLTSIIEGANDLIAALDLDFRFIAFNKAYRDEFSHIFGREIELGMSMIDALAHLPEEQANALEIWGRALHGEEFTVEREFGARDRARKYFEITYSSIRDENGTLIGASHIVRDVSKRKQAEIALRESESRLRFVVENSPDNIFIQDRDLRYVWVSKAAYPFDRKEVFGKTDFDLVTPDDARLLSDIKQQVMNEGKRITTVIPLTLKGHSRILEATYEPWRDGTDAIIGVAGYVRDITERHAAEEELKNALVREQKARAEAEESQRILEAILEYIPEGLTIADAPDVTIRMVSRFGRELIERTEDEITNIPVEEHPDAWQVYHMEGTTLAAPDELPLTRATRKGEIVVNEERLLRRADGKDLTILCNAGPIRDKSGAITGGLIVWRDITDRKRMEETIKHIAHHDALTGLPNRRLFTDILTLELAKARRNQGKFAVLFLDLDKFKYINDTLGHAIGDALLREAAQRLRHAVRASDTVARIGGDEFNVLLTDITHTEDVITTAHKMIEAFKKPYVIDGHELHASTSIGISIYPDDAESSEELFKKADIAMYHAKESGGSTYQFYDAAMNIRTVERLRLEGWLRQSLQRGELEVYYQPQVTADTQQVVCAEALVRWRHPEQGLLDPKHFISLAEETGFITAIDEWVLRAVCTQLKEWQEAGLSSVCVTVNLSAKQFQKSDLVEQISHLLEETGLQPAQLSIEITESTAMKNLERTIPTMNRLADMGIRIAIDDFGTGYSSLNYLKKLPIHKLKIDQSFVKDIDTDPDDRAIVEAVTALAHSMRLRVIAEGVETDEQLEFLRLVGCHEIQGYLFSKPLPAEEFRELIANSGF